MQKQYRRRNTDSLGDIDEEVDDNASGMQYNRADRELQQNSSRPEYLSYQYYKEEGSSGFERDIHRQSTNEGSKSNRWMRHSQGQLDIDDIPIPTAEDGPKTFEQLLAEKMEAEQVLSQGRDNNEVMTDNRPKKEFLKRKKPAYVPPAKPENKQYRYYSDALGVAKQGSQDSMLGNSAARNSRRSNTQNQSDDRRDKQRVARSARHHHLNDEETNNR